jgi:hypothetical protein
VDGAEPESRAYRYYKPVFLVTAMNVSQEVRSFLEFLCSRTAEKILVNAGHTVMDAKSRSCGR